MTNSQEIMTLLSGVAKDVQTLVRQEGSLLRAELKKDAREAGQVGLQLGIGGLLGGLGSLLLLMGLAQAISYLDPQIPLWGSYLLVGFAATLAGAAFLFKAKEAATHLDLVPKQSLGSLKQDLKLLKPATRPN